MNSKESFSYRANGDLEYTTPRGSLLVFSKWALDHVDAFNKVKPTVVQLEAMLERVPKSYMTFANGGNLGGNFAAQAATNGTSVGINGTKPHLFSAGIAMHEMMHLFGFGHAADDFNGHATVMTPVLQWSPTGVFRIADVNALVARFGLNSSYYGENTTWIWNAQTPLAAAGEVGRLNSHTTLVDGGGVDTLDFSNSTAAQTIDLRSTTGTFVQSSLLREYYWSSVMGGQNNLIIAGQTVIENAIGGQGADIIRGNAVDNVLSGGGGADTLLGGGGNDTLLGGAGDDVLESGAGDDVLDGGAGNDRFVFTEKFGNDRIVNFEVGADKIDLQNSGLSFDDLVITASHPASNGMPTAYDIAVKGGLGAIRIDQASGYGGNPSVPIALQASDFLFGSGGAGRAGDDRLMTTSSADVLFGEGGFDTVDYSSSQGAVTVNLGQTLQSGGHAQGDLLFDIEA